MLSYYLELYKDNDDPYKDIVLFNILLELFKESYVHCTPLSKDEIKKLKLYEVFNYYRKDISKSDYILSKLFRSYRNLLTHDTLKIGNHYKKFKDRKLDFIEFMYRYKHLIDENIITTHITELDNLTPRTNSTNSHFIFKLKDVYKDIVLIMSRQGYDTEDDNILDDGVVVGKMLEGDVYFTMNEGMKLNRELGIEFEELT